MAWETERLELDRERLRAGVAAVFTDAGRGFYLIAELDGERAAQMMITYEWSDWRNGVFWWIQSVYTVPDMRGQGAFRGLYEAVERMAQQQGGVCGLRLYVEAHNEAAQATYRRCGMSETVYRMFDVTR
jgi:GNAT superfamily N-acetyltransferase